MFNNENIKMKVRNIIIVKINHWMIEIVYYGWNINRAILGGFLTSKRAKDIAIKIGIFDWYIYIYIYIYVEDWSFGLSKVSFILLEKYGARPFYYERQKWLGPIYSARPFYYEWQKLLGPLEKHGARPFYYERQKWLGPRLKIANPIKYHLFYWKNMVQDLFTMKDKSD
jgi:hypothetical protein